MYPTSFSLPIMYPLPSSAYQQYIPPSSAYLQCNLYHCQLTYNVSSTILIDSYTSSSPVTDMIPTGTIEIQTRYQSLLTAYDVQHSSPLGEHSAR